MVETSLAWLPSSTKLERVTGAVEGLHQEDHEVISESESHSVVSVSLQSHGLYSLWHSPDQDTGVGSYSLLQGIFPTQGLEPGVLHCGQILYHLKHQESPFNSIHHVKILEGLIFKVIKICVLIYFDNLKSYQYILLIYFTEMQMSKITALSLLISLY